MTIPALLWTCEHAGNRVPPEYSALFRGAESALSSHRGYDPGAERIWRYLSRRLGGRAFSWKFTRLLIDVNRSDTNPRRFSDFSRRLPPELRQTVERRYYAPYWQKVLSWVGAQSHTVVHVSVHTFVPELGGVRRRADVGLLYWPQRRRERHICRKLAAALQRSLPELRLRYNYPYTGRADSLVSALRTEYAEQRYIGIELEVNQRWFMDPALPSRSLFGALRSAFATLVETGRGTCGS